MPRVPRGLIGVLADPTPPREVLGRWGLVSGCRAYLPEIALLTAATNSGARLDATRPADTVLIRAVCIHRVHLVESEVRGVIPSAEKREALAVGRPDRCSVGTRLSETVGRAPIAVDDIARSRDPASRVKATTSPLGHHSGQQASPLPCVSWRSLAPSGSFQQLRIDHSPLASPVNRRRNAMCPPSGDQAGQSSFEGMAEMCDLVLLRSRTRPYGCSPACHADDKCEFLAVGPPNGGVVTARRGHSEMRPDSSSTTKMS